MSIAKSGKVRKYCVSNPIINSDLSLKKILFQDNFVLLIFILKYNHIRKGIFMNKFFKNILIVLTAGILAINLEAIGFNDTLKFAHLSDSHLTLTKQDTTFKALGHSKDLLADAISQINQTEGLDFVMQTGDTVDVPNEKDIMLYMSMMNSLRYPWFVAFGNHDLSVLGGEITREKYLTLLNSHNKNFNFNKSYYSLKPKKGFKVIVLDAVDNSKITGNGIFPKEELEWLDSELKKSKKDTVLIFLHHPLIEPFPSSHHKILNIEEFYSVIDKYKNPIAIFSGHYHATKIIKENNVVHVSTPALVTYPNAFRIVSITNYRNKTIFDFYFKNTNLKEVQAVAKLKSFLSSTCAGAESDQTTTIVIDK